MCSYLWRYDAAGVMHLHPWRPTHTTNCALCVRGRAPGWRNLCLDTQGAGQARLYKTRQQHDKAPQPTKPDDAATCLKPRGGVCGRPVVVLCRVLTGHTTSGTGTPGTGTWESNTQRGERGQTRRYSPRAVIMYKCSTETQQPHCANTQVLSQAVYNQGCMHVGAQ